MKGRDVRVEIRRKHLTMSYHDVTGEWVTVVDGDLTWDVNKEECMWTLVPREHVHVSQLTTIRDMLLLLLPNTVGTHTSEYYSHCLF